MSVDAGLAVTIARLFVASVLFAAGVFKVRQFAGFRNAVAASQLFNTPALAVILVGVPVAELLLPVWLVLSIDSRVAAGATVALLIAFTIYVFVLQRLGRDGACGCFGGTAKISDPFVARNIGLASLISAGLDQASEVYFLVCGAALLAFRVFRSVRPRRPARATAPAV